MFQFIGEKGYVADKRNGGVEVFSPQRVDYLQPEDQNAFVLEICDFLEAVKGKPANGATLEDALRSQQVLSAALLSAKTGKDTNVQGNENDETI